MKKIIYFIVCFCSIHLHSQDVFRTDVQGKIIVEHSDISGITIFNASSNKGTITGNNGEFEIAVALNDIIEVSALQFQNLSFKVNEAIVASRKMKIFLIEEINKLDEIIVSTGGLSGNLNTDIEASKTFNPKLDALYFGVKHSSEYNFEKDHKTEVNNLADETQRTHYFNGLNIINVVDQLLLPLFRSEAKNSKEAEIPLVPAEAIKYYFASEFLIDNFNIPEHRVEDFIKYVESNNFDFSLLSYGRELEFLELLNQKSIAFLRKK